MIVLKALSIVIAGMLSFLVLRLMMREMQAVKVRSETRYRQARPPRAQVRLRQDPRTGIYYPEG